VLDDLVNLSPFSPPKVPKDKLTAQPPGLPKLKPFPSFPDGPADSDAEDPRDPHHHHHFYFDWTVFFSPPLQPFPQPPEVVFPPPAVTCESDTPVVIEEEIFATDSEISEVFEPVVEEEVFGNDNESNLSDEELAADASGEVLE